MYFGIFDRIDRVLKRIQNVGIILGLILLLIAVFLGYVKFIKVISDITFNRSEIILYTKLAFCGSIIISIVCIGIMYLLNKAEMSAWIKRLPIYVLSGPLFMLSSIGITLAACFYPVIMFWNVYLFFIVLLVGIRLITIFLERKYMIQSLYDNSKKEEAKRILMDE